MWWDGQYIQDYAEGIVGTDNILKIMGRVWGTDNILKIMGRIWGDGQYTEDYMGRLGE